MSADELPLLARAGHRWLAARAVTKGPATQPVHLLDDVERAAVDAIHRGADGGALDVEIGRAHV